MALDLNSTFDDAFRRATAERDEREGRRQHRDVTAAAEALYGGARDNLPDLCAEFYGEAGNTGVNVSALKLAAENKSYDAFERMLAIAADSAFCGPYRYGISEGPDWDSVYKIAKDDGRIAGALQGFEEVLDVRIKEMFELAEDMEEPAYETEPVQPKASESSFFSKFKFW